MKLRGQLLVIKTLCLARQFRTSKHRRMTCSKIMKRQQHRTKSQSKHLTALQSLQRQSLSSLTHRLLLPKHMIEIQTKLSLIKTMGNLMLRTSSFVPLIQRLRTQTTIQQVNVLAKVLMQLSVLVYTKNSIKKQLSRFMKN